MKKMSTLFLKDPNGLGRVIDQINPENQWVLDDVGVKATRKFDGTSCVIIGGKLYKRYDVKKDKKTDLGFGYTKVEGKIVIAERFHEEGNDYLQIALDLGPVPAAGCYWYKPTKIIPTAAIPCCDPDPRSGHWPHWVPCDRDNPSDKYHFEGYENLLEPHFPTDRKLNVDQSIALEDDWIAGGQFDGTYELCGPKVQGNPEGFDKHVLVRHGEVGWPHCNDRTFEEYREFLSELDVEGIVFHHPDGRMCKLRKSDFGIKR